MARHHYVPQFLLRQWATNGRFVSYYFEASAGKVIENTKAAVASACQIPDLNTFFDVPASQRDLPEKELTRRVDTPAALAFEVVLARRIRALTSKQRNDWARLIVSFAVRTPETLRDMGPSETRNAFDLVAAAAKGPPEAERKVTAFLKAKMSTFQRNSPLKAALELSADPGKLAAVANMAWWVRRLPQPAFLMVIARFWRPRERVTRVASCSTIPTA